VELNKLYYSTYFFLYFSPFAKCNQPEMEKIVQEILQNEANHPDVIVLDIQSSGYWQTFARLHFPSLSTVSPPPCSNQNIHS
jgi:hypothetical protein